MHTIGIIGAMEEEVALLRERLEAAPCGDCCGLSFYSADIKSRRVIIVKSGIGKVNAAVCAQVLIDRFGADAVINVGVAGGVDDKLEIGDIVISSDAVEHDMDASPLGDPRGTIPRMEESYFKADTTLAELAIKASEETLSGHRAYMGRVASGDQFIVDNSVKAFLHDELGASCAEMEGAAIAHVCWLNKTPFVIVRSISDNVNGNNGISFEEFTPLAAKNSAAVVLKILESL